MTGILDCIAKSQAPAVAARHFNPTSPEQFFALLLARRLNDAVAVRHYLELCGRYSPAQLLLAYRETISSSPNDPARTFHAILERSGVDNELPHRDLAAISIERRAIAVAIFSDRYLKYPPLAHQLPSDSSKALGSAASFVNRLRDKCSFANAALEILPPGLQCQRSQLDGIIGQVLQERQVALWRCAKAEVIASFGQPPLRFRDQVRELMTAMWPEIDGSFGGPLIKDALALGLYCQTDYLFNPSQP